MGRGSAKKSQHEALVEKSTALELSPWNAEPTPENLSGPCVVVLGPIIGKVTTSAARILVEVNARASVTVTLSVDSSYGLAPQAAPAVPKDKKKRKSGKAEQLPSQTKMMESAQPSIFAFQGLRPDTKYNVRITGVSNTETRTGSFHTMPTEPSAVRIVALACDKFKESSRGDPATDLWLKVYKDYIEPERVDVFLHLGDQVYADYAFEEAYDIFKSVGGKVDDRVFNDMVECYRRVYRKTWNYVNTRRVYAHASHLMIWDDHELRNDWGTFPKDKDPSSDQYRVALAARRAYWEYQRQLWDDIDLSRTDGIVEAQVHVIGRTGIVITDQRGGRSFSYKPGDSMDYLGKDQWDFLQKSFAANGVLRDTDTLILTSTVPLFYTNPLMSRLVGKLVAPMKDKVGFGIAPHERSKLLDLISDWKTAGKRREVILLGGDMHCGSVSEVYKNGERVAVQMVTSPMANKALWSWRFTWYKFMMCGDRWQDGRYEFRHHKTKFVRSRNFLHLTVQNRVGVRKEDDSLIDAKFVTPLD